MRKQTLLFMIFRKAWTFCVLGTLILECTARSPKVYLFADPKAEPIRAKTEVSMATGVAIYKGVVYLSTTTGVLELGGPASARLFQWDGYDTVTEDIVFDRANDLLWVYVNADNEFAVFDGKQWERVKLPRKKGPRTRGEVLEGIRLDSNSAKLFACGAGRGWTWDAMKEKWQTLDMPQRASSGGRLFALIPCSEDLFAVYAQTHGLFWVPSAASSDEIGAVRNGAVINFPSAAPFQIQSSEPCGRAGYILTRGNALLEVTRDGVRDLDDLKEVQAICSTSEEQLLVFGGNPQGAYLRKGANWTRLGDFPVSVPKTNCTVYLAEQEGTVCLSWSIFDGYNSTRDPEPIPIWKWDGSNWRSLQVGRR